MRIMFGHSIKRLIREGAKSLSVPLIAFVLVILINLLGGIRAWLVTQYLDTIENYRIVAVVSDLTGIQTDDLNIDMRYIDLFFDPDVHFSLKRYTGDIAMRRVLENTIITGHIDDVALIGITSIEMDAALDPELGAIITFFDGYDESVFTTDELLCIVSEELYALAENGVLDVAVTIQMPDEFIYFEGLYTYGTLEDHKYIIYIDDQMVEVDPEDYMTIIPGEIVKLETELNVIGTVTGAGYDVIYSPFWTVSALFEELTGLQPYTESLSMTLGNNRSLNDFKGNAAMSFSQANPVYDNRPFAMTIYDSEYYETLEPLRQNIIVVDVATPFIYVLSIAVGFLTSVLLTRRRKAEFAIMRSIGVNKWVVFISALAEQALLSVVGVALGFAFVAVAWGYTSLTRPAVFLGCYLLGAVFAAAGAAGTNVMKVLRDKRE